MSNNVSEQAYRINVTNPKYCIVTADEKTGTTYGPVQDFGEAMEIQLTSIMSTGELYGNGVKVDGSSKLVGITASMQNTKVPVEVQADIYGYTVTNGVVQVKAGVQAKYIALGYEVEQSNGKSELVWLLKGRPRPMNSDVKQSEGNVTYSTDTIEIDFVKRVSDGMLKYFADGANADFTSAQADKWFLNGPATVITA